jgi:nucleoside-diphosphate-sugar epimerase
VDDVAAATIAAVGNPAASPAVYNLVDCYARWCDWARVIADRLGVEVEIDDSSPMSPKNMFETTATNEDLGVPMNRGFDGITRHIEEMISLGA